MNIEQIRNFCIISHVDHGKSTLADRLLEVTHTIPENKMRSQFLDKMDLEREKGITIKMQPVRMLYKPELTHSSHNGPEYILNLIDTPGHVDFGYEVSRALMACEGAILLVDAQKGIQAQTLSNLEAAKKTELTIIPVINKIDLPGAQVEAIALQIAAVLEIDPDDISQISGKTGAGVDELLLRVVDEIPPPKLDEKPRALIFDSVFDEYRGVVSYIRSFGGKFQTGQQVRFLATGHSTTIDEVGYFNYQLQKSDQIEPGEIGYLVTGLKDISLSKIGDTVVLTKAGTQYPQALTGFTEPQPKVFASFYTLEGQDFTNLKRALEKLRLNDNALTYIPESSVSFGHGFRCGFLGLLHMEISKERLEREFDLDLVVTPPTAVYKYKDSKGKEVVLKNPSLLPEDTLAVYEQWAKVEVVAPGKYIGPLMSVIQNYRSTYVDTKYLEGDNSILVYEIPLSEIMTDFYDQLKSSSAGFASMHYELLDWREGNLVKLEIDIATTPVDAFAQIVHKDKAQPVARRITQRLKELIPRQLFDVRIQARVGGKILASENISPLRKDVTAKLYGGDRTRKDKLLKKQAAGKKKMKQIGRVEIPNDLFLKFYKDN